EPGIKGDSSRSGTKPAKIATGTVVEVPLFINVDDWVKIDTRTGIYVERVKNES
ncbi:MAG: elongation factor P, partial [Candidatus Omnitrophica bacterium]|nr:elongation factor P [Candidatus Omnitrophota bacterium]